MQDRPRRVPVVSELDRWDTSRQRSIRAPPAHEVLSAMGALEKFLHNDPVKTPILVKAALAHAQFETIHPFLDGNGRVGRLDHAAAVRRRAAVHVAAVALSQPVLEAEPGRVLHVPPASATGEWEEWLGSSWRVSTRSLGPRRRPAAARPCRRRQAIHGLGRASGSALVSMSWRSVRSSSGYLRLRATFAIRGHRRNHRCTPRAARNRPGHRPVAQQAVRLSQVPRRSSWR